MTSCVHGIGNGNSIKKVRESKYFSEQVHPLNVTAFISDNTTVGDNVLVSLYNGKPGETLNTLHYEKFCKKIAYRSSHVKPQSLLSTSAVARYRIAGIFRSGKCSFYAGPEIFVRFIFVLV